MCRWPHVSEETNLLRSGLLFPVHTPFIIKTIVFNVPFNVKEKTFLLFFRNSLHARCSVSGFSILWSFLLL